MINITITAREKDFLKSVIEYFEECDLTNGYTKTRKGYKFTKEEMGKLQEKLNKNEPIRYI